MTKHCRTYLQYFEIGEQDTWFCEGCMKEFHINSGLEIHHIKYRSHGGTDEIENLICLCVSCHNRAHFSKNHVTPDEFQYIHNYFLTGQRKQFLC